MAKLSKEDKVRLFDYLELYECEFKFCFTHFNINDSNLQSLMRKYDVYLDSVNKDARKASRKHKNFCLFEHRKNSRESADDIAHHLLRHIRNAIAHGLIKKEKGNVIRLSDRKQKTQKQTMDGKMEQSVFFNLLEALIQTKDV